MRSVGKLIAILSLAVGVFGYANASPSSVSTTTCEIPQQSSQTTCNVTVSWHGHPGEVPGDEPGGIEQPPNDPNLPACVYIGDTKISCAETGSATVAVSRGLNFFTVRRDGIGDTVLAGTATTIGLGEYTPPFSWSASTHASISGDFSGNGEVDLFVQPIDKTSQSGLMPQLLNDEYISGFHQGWTGAHPQVSAIDNWSQENYSAFSGNFNSNPGDELLLLGNKNIILLHGDIITPIVTFPQVQNAIVSWNGSNNASHTAFEFDANPADYNVIIGDLSNDGYDEIFLQAKSKYSTSYILSNTGSLVQTLKNGYLNIDWSGASYSAVISGGKIQLTPKTSADDYNETNHNSSGAVSSLQTAVTKSSISGAPIRNIFEDQTYYFSPEVDGSVNSFNFTATGLPTWLTLDSTTGVLSGTPKSADTNKKHSIKLTVKENKSHSVASTLSFTIEVHKGFSISQSNFTVYRASDGTLFLLSSNGSEVFKVVEENGAKFLVETTLAELNAAGAQIESGYQVSFSDSNFDGLIDLVIQGASGSGLESFSVSNVNGTYHDVVSIDYDLRAELDHGPDSLPSKVSNPLDGLDSNPTVVGSIPAEFSVKPSGSAAYDIPIIVAPGAGGMVPNISLSYDSLSANGALGVGWNIKGLSKLSGCPQNYEQDGEKVNISNKLCLNGKKLNFNESKGYYESEDKTIGKITRDETSGEYTHHHLQGGVTVYKGGKVFRKIDPSGNYIEYKFNGEYLDKVLYGGNLSIGKVSRNALEFIYQDRIDKALQRTSSQTTYYLLERLKYVISRVNTGSDGIGGDILRKYELEYKYSETTGRSLVDWIQVCRQTSCLPKTRFEWQEGSEEVAEQYRFTNGNSSQYWNSKYGSVWGYKVLDFDGDGILDYWKNKNDSSGGGDDLLVIKGGGEFKQLESYNNFLSDRVKVTLTVLDYDSDGKDDAIFNKDGRWHIIHAKKMSESRYHDFDNPIDTGIPVGQNELGFNHQDGNVRVADFDGDGFPDIYYLSENTIWLRYNLAADLNSSSNQTYFGEPVSLGHVSKYVFFEDLNDLDPSTQPNPDPVPESHDWYRMKNFILNFSSFFRPIRLNRDNVLDFLIASQQEHRESYESGNWYIYKSFPNSNGRINEHSIRLIRKIAAWYNPTEGLTYEYPGKNWRIFTPDINGDGYSDYVGVFSSDEKNYLGVSLIKPNWSPIQYGNGYSIDMSEYFDYETHQNAIKLYFADQNNDGHLDLIHNSTNDSNFYIKYGDGEQFGESELLHSGSSNFPDVLFTDINGDGHNDHAYFHGGMHHKLSLSDKRDVITAISDGSNIKRSITYSHTVHEKDDDAITKDWGNGSRVLDSNAPIYLVSSTKKMVDTLNDCGSTNCKEWMSFSYAGLKAQMGRGLLGYREFEVVDHLHNKTITTEYHQDFPFTGAMKSRVVVHGNEGEQQITTTDVLYNTNDIGLPYAQESTTKVYDNDTWLSETLVTNLNVDDFGRPQTTETVTTDKINGGVFSTTEVATYELHDLFYGGRLTRHRTNYSRTGQPTIKQVTDYEYFSNTGLVWKKITDPSSYVGTSGVDETDQTYGVTETYTRDSFGNITSTLVTGADGIERRADVEFDTHGRYPVKTITYPNYPDLTRTVESSTEYHSVFGTKISETSANDQTTYFGYSTLGRLNFENSPNGSYTTTDKTLCSESSDCPATAYFKETITASHGPDSVIYYDGLAQKIMEKSENLTCYNTMGLIDGCSGESVSWIFKTYRYDNKGQLIAESRPHFENELGPLIIVDPSIGGNWTIPQGYSNYTYDSQGRPIKHFKFDRSEWTTSYSGFDTTITNPASNSTTKRTNALGELIKATDANSQEVTYGYDSLGSLNLVRRAHSAISGSGFIDTVIESDHLGRKLSMTDPDKGTIKYRYNSFGELVWQQDNKNQQSFTDYDSIGRQTEFKSYKDFDNNIIDQHTRFHYDQAANGIGLVHQEEDVVNGITKDYYYNVMSQPTEEITSFSNGRRFSNDYVYDDLFRVIETYDASHSRGGVTYTYYDNYLVKKTDRQSQAKLWQFLQSDAIGNTTAFEYGNGIVNQAEFDQTDGSYEILLATKNGSDIQNETYNFDNLGNLDFREDHVIGLREDFNYDSLNRLDDWSVTYGNSVEQFDIAYDHLGNISSKTGMGNYRYGEYRCGNQAGPHAVTQAGSFTYCYDRNGNMTSGGGRTSIAYNTNDKPTSIITTKNHRIDYVYGLGGSRFKRVDTSSDGTSKETLYIGNVEFISQNGQLNKILRHIEGVALETTTVNTGAKKLEFLHRDHLGSIALITDINGAVVNRFSYDPWGERRDEQTFLQRNYGSIDSGLAKAVEDFKRGFTGHEHIDEAGLIHMNGRVYDPRLGRFLSADPFVKTAESLQSFNRYTYVSNNPLNATDPSGYIEMSFGFDNMYSFNSWNSDTYWAMQNANFYQLTNSDSALINSFQNGVGESAVAWGHLGEQRNQLNGKSITSANASADKDGVTSRRTSKNFTAKELRRRMGGGYARQHHFNNFSDKQKESVREAGTIWSGVVIISAAAVVSPALLLEEIIAEGTGAPLSLSNMSKKQLAKESAVAGAKTAGRQFWKNSTSFRGVTVFQRDDIFDPSLMTTWKDAGKTIRGTNLERMAAGRAPIGVDGKSVNLHHMTQRNNSGIAEMTQSFHQTNSKVIHINPNTIPSGINRSQFNTWKSNYWMYRASKF